MYQLSYVTSSPVAKGVDPPIFQLVGYGLDSLLSQVMGSQFSGFSGESEQEREREVTAREMEVTSEAKKQVDDIRSASATS
jgi:hypothetical protein